MGDATSQTVTRVYEGLRPDEVRNQERKLRSVGTVDVRLRSSPAPHHLTAQDLVCDRLEWSQQALAPDEPGTASISAKERLELIVRHLHSLLASHV